MNHFQLITIGFVVLILGMLIAQGATKLWEVITDLRDDHVGAFKTKVLWVGLAIAISVYLGLLTTILYRLIMAAH